MERVDRAMNLLTTAAALVNTFAPGSNTPRLWNSLMITGKVEDAEARFDENTSSARLEGFDLFLE